MSEEVKRYSVFIGFEHGEQQMILATDHDRIVADLQQEVDDLQTEKAAMQCLRDMAREERDALRAEVERLRKQVEALQAAPNSWQSGYDKGRRDGDRFSREERDALRKDAERYRWLRRPESGNALFTLTGSGECGPNMDSAIEAAMAAKDGA